MHDESMFLIGILYCLILFYIPFFLAERFGVGKLFMNGGAWACMSIPGFTWMYLDWNWFLYWFLFTFGVIFFWYYMIVYRSDRHRALYRDGRYELARNSREHDEWIPFTIAEIIKDLKDKKKKD